MTHGVFLFLWAFTLLLRCLLGATNTSSYSAWLPETFPCLLLRSVGIRQMALLQFLREAGAPFDAQENQPQTPREIGGPERTQGPSTWHLGYSLAGAWGQGTPCLTRNRTSPPACWPRIAPSLCVSLPSLLCWTCTENSMLRMAPAPICPPLNPKPSEATTTQRPPLQSRNPRRRVS